MARLIDVMHLGHDRVIGAYDVDGAVVDPGPAVYVHERAAPHIHVLQGGETVEACRVEYAPGQASHHVVYLHDSTGECFVGDVRDVEGEELAVRLAQAAPPDQLYLGLERYWRKRAEREDEAA